MSKNLFKRFRDDRKYFTIVLFILFLILISGIVTPVILEKQKDNWKKQIDQKILSIEAGTNQVFLKREIKLLDVKDSLKNQLSQVLGQSKSTYGSLIRLINNDKYSSYSIEVLAPNGKLIGWNDVLAIKQEDVLPLSYPAGEAHFYRSDLVTYLTVTDTLFIDNDQFYILVSHPIEKNYSLQSPFFNQINFSKELSDHFATQFEIAYNPFAPPTKDGRQFSFDLLNNKDNKIGVVTFSKPSLDLALNTIQSDAAKIQTILAILAFLFLGISLKREFKTIRYSSAKFLILVIYFTLFRMIFFKLGFPSNLLSGVLTDSGYFSSAFGGGIVKSPIEFFVTSFFALLVGIKAFAYSFSYLKNSERSKFKYLRTLLIIPIIPVYFLIFRGLSASIRSIIFDSTLRYFKSPDLIPSFPALSMIFSTLIFGISVIFVLTSLVTLLISFLPLKGSKKSKLFFVILFVLFEIFGIVFFYLQNTPLITPILSIILIALFFSFIYIACFTESKNPIYNYVFATLLASIVTISLMNYFNLELERESLKTTALELNRSNESLLKFFLTETLNNAAENEELKRSYSVHNSNADAVAFIIWSGSALQRESINSAVVILDKKFKRVGRFSMEPQGEKVNLKLLKDKVKKEPIVIEKIDKNEEGSDKLVGLIAVKERGITLGYVLASIEIDILNPGRNIPEFLESRKNILNSVIEPEQLKIFEFRDSRVSKVYGDIFPSLNLSKTITNAQFSADNEAWLTLNLSGESYVAYILKNETGNETKITTVAVLEKNLSWNLYNFFKIFIIHSFFILLLFLILFSSQFRKFRYSFRTQLLIALLIVSIIPVFILAVYNRQIIKEKSQLSVIKELNERSVYVENHLKAQLKDEGNKGLQDVFRHAGNELKISFSIYEGTTQIFNSKEQYYKAGLFTNMLDPEAYYQLNYLNYREALNKEKVNDFTYNAFFRRTDIDKYHFIISVNDAFNKVEPAYSVIDIDVFLFGIYSFASILIILISTILANKISSPIRRLTKATESIAHGDFNVEIDNNQRGEVRDLLDGFNSMTMELQKNQVELAELERENAWKEMAKQVAHEIKNPLTPMKLTVQQLIISYKDKNKNFDNIFKKVSTTLLNQIESLSQIATEFSRFARMPNYNMEELDLLPILHDVINLFMEEKVEINIQSPVETAIIEADKVQLRRLFINLIRNSIQAQADSIDINLSVKRSKLRVSVKDNGTGIPDQYKSKIFEANFTTKEKGMGIGLKIAKRFMESIKGDIVLKENSEKETNFEIIIPLKKQKEDNTSK